MPNGGRPDPCGSSGLAKTPLDEHKDRGGVRVDRRGTLVGVDADGLVLGASACPGGVHWWPTISIMVTVRADIGVVAHPAVVIVCDVAGYDRVLAVTGEASADYRSARAYARGFRWVVHPSEQEWCREHEFAYGGAGVPVPYEDYRVDDV